MTDKQRKKISRKLALVLRHRPEVFNLQPDGQGWCEVEAVLAGFCNSGEHVTRDMLGQVVMNCDKQRYAFSEDGRYIRANQGHSIPVELGYRQATPPDILYHGTATRYLGPILREGLRKGNRHHVHLSADRETAAKVGRRHGKVAILRVDSRAMQEAGYAFFRSANGVWLAEHVPEQFLEHIS